MADKPILFSGPMVWALLREIEQPGTGKTQTRRIPSQSFFEVTSEEAEHFELLNYIVIRHDDMLCAFKPQPLCGVGDRLWVRETWNSFIFSQDGETAWPSKTIPTKEDIEDPIRFDEQIIYKESDRASKWFSDQKWRPGIHMPRFASRITLEVTDVRIQRLQDITEEDAIAEGIEPYGGIDPECDGFLNYHDLGKSGWWLPPCESFKTLWDSINGKPRKPGGPDISWNANPWVVAYTFKPHLCNIDKMEE